MCILSLQQCKKGNKACQPFMKFKLFDSLENTQQVDHLFISYLCILVVSSTKLKTLYQVLLLSSVGGTIQHLFSDSVTFVCSYFVHMKKTFSRATMTVYHMMGVCVQFFCTTFASFSFWISSTFLQCLKCMCKGKNLFSLRREIQHKSKQHSLAGILAKIHCDKGAKQNL